MITVRDCCKYTLICIFFSMLEIGCIMSLDACWSYVVVSAAASADGYEESVVSNVATDLVASVDD